MRCFIDAVGLVAPGLQGWEKSRAILAGDAAYQADAIAPFSPQMLPVNERRRITPTIRIALQAATEALDAAGIAAQDLLSVFASSNGDLDISDRICAALAAPGRPVSPTDFHNSVHNAPAGYWAIGNACRQASTSVSAGRASFAAGLLEAVSQSVCDARPVLLVCYELPVPAALSALWRVDQPFAVGLLLNNRQSANCLGQLQLKLTRSAHTVSESQHEALRLLLQGNSAAQCLPLLELVAREAGGHCILPYVNGTGARLEFSC